MALLGAVLLCREHLIYHLRRILTNHLPYGYVTLESKSFSSNFEQGRSQKLTKHKKNKQLTRSVLIQSREYHIKSTFFSDAKIGCTEYVLDY
jgi:hypothetical protein